jgi:general secretion pathway protein G
MYQRGFTLVELVVTVAIVALLSSVAMPMVEISVQRGREQELRYALRQIREAIDAYKLASDEGKIARNLGSTGYPKTLASLADGVEDIKSPTRKKIYFLRNIPRDALMRDPAVKPEATWGLRSYASTAEDPTAGDDVYDVYSKATGLGLNGIAYRKW